MADTKITALTALTGADPANDVIPIVDVSDTTMAASGTTKKISVNNILGASGTATLASATITGDLTVDTSTLYVSSSADKVGIGTTSLSNEKLTVAGNISANAWLGRSNISVPAGDCSIFRSADNTLGFGIASTTAMTLNSTGLGVGGSPVSGVLLTVGSTSSVSATANALQVLSNKATLVVTADGATNGAGTTINYSWANGGQGPLIFRNASISNVMTLDASGNLLVGTTTAGAKITALAGASGQAAIFQQPAQNFWCVLAHNQATSGDNSFVLFGTEASFTSRGSITYNRAAGQVSYNITSDYRLKEDVKPLTGALNRISSLKPSTYKFKETGFTCEGFIAHELAEVIPAAVTGDKDAVNEDGSIKAQGVDLSKVVPVLVAAIQELTARVQTLETR